MKYIFIHIGKTAGTSFRSFLESNISRPYFGYSKLWFLTDVRDTNKFLEVEPRGTDIFNHFNLFSEHFAYGLHPYLSTRDYQYITVLREPVSRTISAYRYAKDRGWIDDSVTIMDWFNTPEQKDQLHYQTNHVSGVPHDVPIEIKKKEGLKNLNDDKFLFGFTEAYNEFIDLCCNKNSWSPQYKKTNVTKAKNDISNSEKETLKESLKHEIEFYNEAIEIYNKKYNKIFKND